MSLATRRAALESLRDQYIAALAADAAAPVPDLSVDGKSTGREAWRANLMKQVIDLDARIAKLVPPAQQRLNVETI